jgi:hypothetical protein
MPRRTVAPFGKRVSIGRNVVTRRTGDELVLLSLDRELYFGLDPVGARMWELLSTSATVADAFRRLLDEYEVDPVSLRADLEKLLAQLEDSGLVELHDV